MQLVLHPVVHLELHPCGGEQVQRGGGEERVVPAREQPVADLLGGRQAAWREGRSVSPEVRSGGAHVPVAQVRPPTVEGPRQRAGRELHALRRVGRRRVVQVLLAQPVAQAEQDEAAAHARHQPRQPPRMRGPTVLAIDLVGVLGDLAVGEAPHEPHRLSQRLCSRRPRRCEEPALSFPRGSGPRQGACSVERAGGEDERRTGDDVPAGLGGDPALGLLAEPLGHPAGTLVEPVDDVLGEFALYVEDVRQQDHGDRARRDHEPVRDERERLALTTLARVVDDDHRGWRRRPAQQASQFRKHRRAECLAVPDVARMVAHDRAVVGDPGGRGRQLELLERQRALRHRVARRVEVEPPPRLLRSDGCAELVREQVGPHDPLEAAARPGDQQPRQDERGSGDHDREGNGDVRENPQQRSGDRERCRQRAHQVRPERLPTLRMEAADSAQLRDPGAEGDQRGDRGPCVTALEDATRELCAL